MQKDKVWPLIGAGWECNGRTVLQLLEQVAATQEHIQPSSALERDLPPCSLQFFNGHENSYYRKKLNDRDATQLVEYMNKTGRRLFAHCPFAINLAKDPLEDRRSLDALHADISAVGKAGISSVCHIGHHLNKFSMETVCRTLSALDFWGMPGSYPLLLENAAGDGTELGVSWAELHFLAQNTDPHIGFCIDTQHSFPGLQVNLTTPDGVEEFLKAIDRTVGLHRVKLFHLNDSVWHKQQVKGRKDAHAQLGKGHIWGQDTRHLAGLNHLLLRGGELNIPFITETTTDDPYRAYSVLQQFNCAPGL